jgi:hypothetical protein
MTEQPTDPDTAPDPGPIVPSGGEEQPPTIDPADDPQPDPDERGLAHRDEDQAAVDQEMGG